MNIRHFVYRLADLVNLYIEAFYRRFLPLRYNFSKNIFRSNHDKSVLISYVIDPFILPFRGNKYYSHSNYQESVTIAKVFHKLGYKVDVVRYNTPKNDLPHNKYQIIFGHDPNLTLAQKNNPKALTIFYATGAYGGFRNQEEKKRIIQLLKRKKLPLNSLSSQWSNIADDYQSFARSPHIIMIGDKTVLSTHPKKFHPKIKLITVSTYCFYPWEKQRHYKKMHQARRNFLCLISSAPVHKGLDLLLEVFKRNPRLHLYVAGNIGTDSEFEKIYHAELYTLPNIHCLGWVDLASTKFRDLATICGSVVLASASEGINGAVPNCMRSGLIPITSHYSAVNTLGCGISINTVTIDNLEKAVRRISLTSPKILKTMANQASETANDIYSIKAFENQFTSIITNLLAKR